MNINLTLIGQMVAFVFFVAFCMKFVWPPIMSAMAERASKISEGLAAADRASQDLELAQKRAGEQLREAKTEAAAIIEAANKRSNALIEEAKAAAVAEANKVKAQAQSEIEQERNRLKAELRKEVAALSLIGAEKVLGATIDQSAHAAMLDNLAAELH